MSVLLYPDEFENEYIEDFWTQQIGGGSGGAIEEISTGSLRMQMRGESTPNWDVSNTGDQGTQLYQPVAYDQEFDVVVSCFVESDFYTLNYSPPEMNFGLFWKRQDDVGNESNSEYFRIMARGDGNWATNYQYQGQAETETTAANFDQTDFYFRLTRSGTGGPMTMRSYYSLTGVSGSWTLHAEETSSQFRFAGWVGIGGTKDFQDGIVPCYTKYFRNYPATYKLAGTISHDGYLSLIPNESYLSDWGESPDTYPLTASGTWEIYTSFSGVVSVVGRRDSDDKVVGVGGLTPIIVP